MRKYHYFGCYFMALFVAFAEIAWCQQYAAGGWIDSFDGPVEAYVLKRKGENIQVAIYMPVYVGDQIMVSEGYKLKIGKSDGSILTIDHAAGKHVIKESDSSVALLDNILQWAGEWFSGYLGDNTGTQIASMVSRADEMPPISMSLFPTGQARLLAGNRKVSLYWEGGQTPYGIRIYSQDKTYSIASLEGLDERRVAIGPINLKVGSYYMEVSDAHEVEIVRIDVVSEDMYPEKPPEMHTAEMPVEVMNNLETMWLASQGNGIWVLEAYQRIPDKIDEQAATRLLRKALEQGFIPAK